MAYHESAGFLRDDPPAGQSVGALVVTGIAAGGGGAGDASAANQATQIGIETTTRDNVATAILRLEAIRDRLPPALDPDGGLLVHVVNGAGGGLTDVQLRATPVPVSGPLTDAQLRASAVPVSLGSTDITDRAARLLGHVTVDNASLAVTGPLTDAQIRAAPLPVSGTVTANAGAGPFPVSDNAGSLTVDAPVATPVAARLSDGAAFIDPRDTSDRAARLLGHVTVDNASLAVTGPLTDAQLRASAVSEDTTDRATRELGRVRIWDGTDEATVVPVRTQPATTEKTIPTFDLPNRLATYATTIATQAPAITIGVKNMLDLWHPSTITQDIYIVELWATALITVASTTGGRTTVRVSTITSAPTGGTALTASDIGGAGASAFGAGGNLMQVKTGGGAVGSTFIRKQAEFATNPIGRLDIPVFQASNPGNGIILRGGSNAGICIDIEREVAHTAMVDLWTVGVRWLEL